MFEQAVGIRSGEMADKAWVSLSPCILRAFGQFDCGCRNEQG